AGLRIDRRAEPRRPEALPDGHVRRDRVRQVDVARLAQRLVVDPPEPGARRRRLRGAGPGEHQNCCCRGGPCREQADGTRELLGPPYCQPPFSYLRRVRYDRWSSCSRRPGGNAAPPRRPPSASRMRGFFVPMDRYEPEQIERKWQQVSEDARAFSTPDTPAGEEPS